MHTDNERDFRFPGWRVAGACSLGAFFASMPLGVFGVFLKPMSDEFSWSREGAASAYGSLALAAAVAAPLMGRVLDRAGARRVIAPCLAASGCALISLAALTPAIWHLRGVFALIGIVTMGASPIAHSRAIFGWFDARRGQALGVVLAGASLSGIVIPPLAHAVISTAGWRVAWAILGSMTLVFGLPPIVAFVRERHTPRAAAGARGPGVPVGDAMRTRAFWTLILALFGGTIAFNGPVVHLAALLTDRGVQPRDAALAVSAMAAASLAGRLSTGLLLDRFPAPRVSVVLLSIAGMGILVLASAQSFLAGMLGAMCLGFGAGGEFDVIPYLLSRYFGTRSISTLYGFNWTAWGLAASISPVLMGRAFDATGTYNTALLPLGAVAFLTAGLIMSLPPVRPVVAAARGAGELAPS